MKTANWIINRLFSDATCHRTERSPHPQPHHLTKYEDKGTKIWIFKLFSELQLGKIWKYNLGFSKIPILVSFMNYTAPDQHFKIPRLNLWISWENLCPNLSFTVENKMENSHKRGWSHFRLKINDWDIPFPKILRVCQWIEKNCFHWGEWNEPIKLIRDCVRLKIKI